MGIITVGLRRVLNKVRQAADEFTQFVTGHRSDQPISLMHVECLEFSAQIKELLEVYKPVEVTFRKDEIPSMDSAFWYLISQASNWRSLTTQLRMWTYDLSPAPSPIFNRVVEEGPIAFLEWLITVEEETMDENDITNCSVEIHTDDDYVKVVFRPEAA